MEDDDRGQAVAVIVGAEMICPDDHWNDERRTRPDSAWTSQTAKINQVESDVQDAKRNIDAALQDIKSQIALFYHVVPDKANWVYQNIGISFKERIIDPNVQEAVKAVTAKYSGVQLIGEREAVSTAI